MRRRSSQGSILLVVLVMVVFTSTALVAFIERAGDELIVPGRVAAANRMRSTAYSALETTISVLSEFNRVNGSLHSPAEGWGDPLAWAQYPVEDTGFEIKVTFEDESGKMSLPNATAQNLTDLFTFWGLDAGLGSKLSDALMVWIKANYTPTSSGVSPGIDFLNEPVPFNPPSRSLRSWDELRSIEVVQDTFFDDNGGLNYFGKRFEDAFSLYKFTTPNVNAGNPDTLAVTASLSSGSAQEALLTYLGTKMQSASGGATTGSYFPTIAAATTASGVASLPGLGVAISALRIHVTVRQKLAVFTLSALVTGFTTPAASTGTTGAAATGRTGRGTGTGGAAATTAATAVAAPTVTASANTATPVSSTTSIPIIALNYPCTVLELTESDKDPADAAAAAAETATESSVNGISFVPLQVPAPSGSFLK